jgi:hypothetical protein
MHNPPTEGNFCNEYGNAVKSSTIEDFSRNIGFADKAHRMVNSYSISRCVWEWAEKIVHLLNLTILNNYILLSSLGGGGGGGGELHMGNFGSY